MTKAPLEDVLLATVTVGERGQIVIPADARKKLDIHAGEKLLMISHPTREGLMFVKISAMREFLAHLAERISASDIPVPEIPRSRRGRRPPSVPTSKEGVHE